MDECIRFNGKLLEELKTRTSWFCGGLQKTMIGKKPDAHEAGVTTILAWRFEFMSNYGRQDINPKNFSWFGDFSRKVGFHIFMSCKPKHVISENLKQKTLRGHLVFSFFFYRGGNEQAFVVDLKYPICFEGNKLSRFSG